MGNNKSKERNATMETMDQRNEKDNGRFKQKEQKEQWEDQLKKGTKMTMGGSKK